MSSGIEFVGALAAIVTTLCWLPQLAKMLRERQAEGVSLVATAALAVGVLLWLIYGLMLGAVPIIAANGATLVFVLMIVGMKLRFG